VKKLVGLLALVLAFVLPAAARAQVPVTPAANQEALLASPDSALAANKRLVYDFWRSVLEGGHMELADKYMTEDYIQHNPNVPTGRAGFVNAFSKIVKPHDIAPTIKAPLVAIVAEGNLVVLAFVHKLPDPKDHTKSYTTTWFDMFRVENGKVAEHWDVDRKE
jgi:predicted SnoaL-like aldol condensation-catalyzing enzyme